MGPLVETTLARWFTEPYRRSHEEVVGHIAHGIGATPVLGYIGCCEAIAKIDVTDRAARDQVPHAGHRRARHPQWRDKYMKT